MDAPFTSLAGRDGLPGQRRQELKRMLVKITDLASTEQVDLLLVCGDLYEQGYTRSSTFHFICDQFKKIPNIPVILIPGNHDPLVSGSFYLSREWPENVRILKDGIDFYEHPATGTRIYGGLPGRSKSLPETPGAGINILMLHGTLDMPFSPNAFHPVSSGELDTYGFDYCALGHFHTVTRGAGRSRNIYNPGSPEPLGFDEEGEHGVYIVLIEKDHETRLDVHFNNLGSRHFLNLEVPVGGCMTDEQVAEVVAKVVREAGSSEDLYRVALTGYVNRSYRPEPLYIAGLLHENSCYIRVEDKTIPDYDFDLLAKEAGLRGQFVRKMLDRVSKVPDEEGRQLVMRALYYGVEAIDEGSVCI